jgi:hypothetical protein
MSQTRIDSMPEGSILTVLVQPRASRTELVGPHGDALKIRIAAPPVDGAANAELARFLANELNIAPSSVEVRTGAGGRRKRVLLRGVSPQRLRAVFNL